jgi:hypothetical protein
MTFMESSANEFMSMYVTGQRAGDPPGTMQAPVLVKVGEDPLRLFVPIGEIPGPHRAGDYSGIAVDPVDGTFWAANEYATAALSPELPISNNWGTWIANFSITDGGASPSAAASEESLVFFAIPQVDGSRTFENITNKTQTNVVALFMDEQVPVTHQRNDNAPRLLLVRSYDPWSSELVDEAFADFDGRFLENVLQSDLGL